jgi:CDP-diacylglycerol--glycerol-3-phosphate 3-phosphatidyltransferase
MGIYIVKPAFQKLLTPVKNLLVRYKVHPTTINVLGLICSLIMAVILLYHESMPLALVLVPVLAFIRTAFNALDGLVSRELHVASRFGEVLNEFIDRVSDAIIFISLGLSGQVSYILASITTIVILLNSYLGIVSKAAGGSRQYGGLIGKADRMIYLSIASLLVLIFKNEIVWNYLYLLLLIGTIISIMQRFKSIKKELQ